jgi:hypothetical protein
MSKKTDAISSMRSAAMAVGGSQGTRTARLGTAERFTREMYSQGKQITGPEGIAQRHVAAYVAARQQAGISIRVIQNELSHIRGIMRGCGREQAAMDPNISNAALDASGASRAGTKVAATEQQYQAARSALAPISPGIAAALALERTLGCRAAEAIRSPPSLRTWERQLIAGQRTTIVFGTKGGRSRESHPADRLAALAAVKEAKVLVKAQGGKLIPGTLRQALTAYRNTMHRHTSITGHQLRYAYAQDRLNDYRQQGYSEKEARALTSVDLGHGDGRGTYVKAVYSRSSADDDSK